MALFNEIQVGRYSTLLQKLFSIKGAAPAPQLAGEIMPTFPLEVDRPEWKYLAGERMAGGGGTVNAVALENSQATLFNPVRSSSIIVLEKWWIRPATAGDIYMGWSPLPSGGGVAQIGSGALDGRFPQGAQKTTGQVWTSSAVGVLITTIFDRRRVATTGYDIEYPIVIPPGVGFGIAHKTVNIALAVQFIWRERKIEADELAAN